MATRRPLVLDDNGRIAEIPTGDQIPAAVVPGGGGGGSQQVFVQETRPTEPGPWAWWVKNASGQVVNLILNDGA